MWRPPCLWKVVQVFQEETVWQEAPWDFSLWQRYLGAHCAYKSVLDEVVKFIAIFSDEKYQQVWHWNHYYWKWSQVSGSEPGWWCLANLTVLSWSLSSSGNGKVTGSLNPKTFADDKSGDFYLQWNSHLYLRLRPPPINSRMRTFGHCTVFSAPCSRNEMCSDLLHRVPLIGALCSSEHSCNLFHCIQCNAAEPSSEHCTVQEDHCKW